MISDSCIHSVAMNSVGGNNGGDNTSRNNLVCVHTLLSQFAEVNIANDDGDTPLILGTVCYYL